jgi:hypothetical protein
LSIGFVVFGCLTAPIELEADRRRASLFLFLSRVFKIVVFSHREWQHSEQESHTCQKLLIEILDAMSSPG